MGCRLYQACFARARYDGAMRSSRWARPSVVMGIVWIFAGCARTSAVHDRPAEVALDAGAASSTPATATATATEPTPTGVVSVIASDASDEPRLASKGPASFSDKEEEDYSGHPHTVVPLDPAKAYVLGSDTVISLRRTACFGSCPVYSVGVTADGTVHFYGESSVVSPGYQTASIGRPAVQALLTFLGAKRFHTLHAQYQRQATDHPSAIITLRQGAAVKRVRHDESNDSEPALAAIEKEIDRVTGSARWIGTPSPGAGRSRGDRAARTIPASAIRAMAGAQLTTATKTCSAGLRRKTTVEIPFSIDERGYGSSGSGMSQGDASLLACLDREVQKIFFPVSGIYQSTQMKVELGP
jgi:hypothetical protein